MSLVIANSVWLKLIFFSLSLLCVEFCPTNNELWLTEWWLCWLFSFCVCKINFYLDFQLFDDGINRIEKELVSNLIITATMCNTSFFWTIKFRLFFLSRSLDILLCVSVFCNVFFSSHGRSELFVSRSSVCVCQWNCRSSYKKNLFCWIWFWDISSSLNFTATTLFIHTYARTRTNKKQ